MLDLKLIEVPMTDVNIINPHGSHTYQASQLLEYKPPAINASPTTENINQLKEWLAFIRVMNPDHGHFYEELENFLGPWGENGYLRGHGLLYKKLFLTHKWLQCKRTKPWGFLAMYAIEGNIASFILHNFKQGNLNSPTLEQDLFKFSLENSHKMFYKGGISSWFKSPHKFIALFILLWPDFKKQPIALLIQAFKLTRLLALELFMGRVWVEKSKWMQIQFQFD